jgi:hypothetical protein
MAACDIRAHHIRCEPHLARLQMVARYEAGEALPPGLPEEVAEATSAILAEAHAAGRVSVIAVANGQRRAVTAILDARLGRLAAAAEEAVAAAKDGDPGALSRHLRKFDVLTSALWTVQLELHATVAPASGHRGAANRGRALGLSLPGGVRPRAAWRVRLQGR